jgi:hypothetical protein
MGVDCIFYVKKFKTLEESQHLFDQLRNGAKNCPVSTGQITEINAACFEINWPYGLTVGSLNRENDSWIVLTTCLRLHNEIPLQYKLMSWINQVCQLEGEERCYVGGDSGQASHLALRRYSYQDLVDAETDNMSKEWRQYHHLMTTDQRDEALQCLQYHSPKKQCRVSECVMCSIRDCPNSNSSHYNSYGCDEQECFAQQVDQIPFYSQNNL